MFLATCPDDWSPVIDNAGNTLNGFYPRIALENDPEIGTTKEQMVHKINTFHHKLKKTTTTYTVTTALLQQGQMLLLAQMWAHIVALRILEESHTQMMA